ncbi:MAG: FAD-dependent oxidoreductase, partial [Aeoliella sp.]
MNYHFSLQAVVITLAMIAAFSPAVDAKPQQKSYDIVVYGGTSAGVIAGIQAAMIGKSVILISPSEHLGGLSSGGLGWTDSGDKRVIGGLSREFYQRIKLHYDRPAAWKWESSQQYTRYRKDSDAMWTFEPHVAEKVFDEWVRDANIEVLRSERLAVDGVVKTKGARIMAIRLESGASISGKMFIDCTYEGDLLAAVGVTYMVGRERNDQYGESINGV